PSESVYVLPLPCRVKQQPGARAGLGDPPQRVTRDDHDRHRGQLTDQVPDRVRLARPRRTVQQHAALEMLPAGDQPPGVPGDAEYLALDAVQQGGREDELAAVEPRAVQEPQQRAAVAAED